MTHAIPPAAFFCPERRQALEQEAEQLSLTHNRRSRRSSFLFVAGIAAYACGVILAAYDAPLFVSWSFVIGAVILGGFAVAIDAVRKGQSPAWGLLSFAGYMALELLPNHVLRRFDAIHEELSGQPGRAALDDELERISLIPMWGVYRVLRVSRQLREKDFPAPLTPLLLAAGSTVAAFGLAGLLFWNSRTDEIAQGKLAFVRLPAGWRDITSSYRDDPRVDVAAKSRKTIAQIVVFPNPKIADATLDQFSQAIVTMRQDAHGSEYRRSGPTVRSVGDRRRIEYVLQKEGNERSDLIEIVTFWETSRHFWFTVATTIQPDYPKVADELRAVADSVYTKE